MNNRFDSFGAYFEKILRLWEFVFLKVETFCFKFISLGMISSYNRFHMIILGRCLFGFPDENYRFFSSKIVHSAGRLPIDMVPVVGPNLDSGYFISFRKLNYEIKGYEIGVTLGHLNIT